jgi:hypothetical protein
VYSWAFPRCCTETAELAPAAGPACTVTDARHIGMASCLQLAWRFHPPNTQLSCAYWSEAATAVPSLQPWRACRPRSRVGVPVLSVCPCIERANRALRLSSCLTYSAVRQKRRSRSAPTVWRTRGSLEGRISRTINAISTSAS